MRAYLTALLIASCLFCTDTMALKVGVTAGPHADITNKVKEIAKAQGLDVDVIEFNDFVLPNEALASHDIDLNSYQHEPYLKGQMESRGYKFKAIAKTVIMPLGVYSHNLKQLSALPQGAQISIPNDPTNEGRTLKLLAKNNLIEIADVANPSILDITSNPKSLKFVPMEAPLLPTSLSDVGASVINTDWVMQAGIDPNSALVQEDKDSPYVNVIVVRDNDESRADIQKFVKIYQSPEIRTFIKDTYKGAVIPAW